MYLDTCTLLTDEAVLALAERLPGLTHISLFGGTEAITSRAMETLVSQCRELEFIELSFCPNVSDATLMKIAEHCPKLAELHVQGCPGVTAAGLTELGSQCSNLKYVMITYTLLYLDQLRQLFPHTRAA